MSATRNVITIRNWKSLNDGKSPKNEDKWSKLESEINLIFSSSNYSSCSLEELYRLAEDLYTNQYAPIHQNLEKIISNYLTKKLQELNQIDRNGDILPVMEAIWKEFCKHVLTIKNIFLRYDRSAQNFQYNAVQSLSLNLFTFTIIYETSIRNKLIGEILALIEFERYSHKIDRDLLKNLTSMMNQLHVYEEIFQEEFLKASQHFYQSESNKLINHYSIPIYLSHVSERLCEEKARTQFYLNSSTEPLILNICRRELVENHMKQILTDGFENLIESNAINELSLLFELFQSIQDGPKTLQEYFKAYVIKKGSVLIDPVSNEKNLVISQVLEFKDNLDRIILNCFGNRKEFNEALRIGFKNFINLHQTKTPQLLAKFVDFKMRSKDQTDEELELTLEKIVKLFKYIQGKDVFEAFYKQYLAKRLLLGKSSSQDAEHSMITKLKEECGDAFTSNIEGMFHDIYLSRTINLSFKDKYKGNLNENLSSEFSVFVLTNSYWPSYANYELHLPVELVNYQDKFQAYYLNTHSGRKLLWKSNLGYCLVRAEFPSGCKELQLSLFQTVILLLFNKIDQLTWKEISELTNLEMFELKRTLLSLSCGKARVLLKNPKGIEVNEDDVFFYNNKFKDKLYRVKINQVQLQESVEEDKETEKNVLVDRQYQIDAAIVRIMKNKKVIKHASLVSELYNILDIPVNQTDLKKRIEMLIEREYMERDKENKSTYIYIA